MVKNPNQLQKEIYLETFSFLNLLLTVKISSE